VSIRQLAKQSICASVAVFIRGNLPLSSIRRTVCSRREESSRHLFSPGPLFSPHSPTVSHLCLAFCAPYLPMSFVSCVPHRLDSAFDLCSTKYQELSYDGWCQIGPEPRFFSQFVNESPPFVASTFWATATHLLSPGPHHLSPALHRFS